MLPPTKVSAQSMKKNVCFLALVGLTMGSLVMAYYNHTYIIYIYIYTLPETNIAPENGLEYFLVSFWGKRMQKAYFQGQTLR